MGSNPISGTKIYETNNLVLESLVVDWIPWTISIDVGIQRMERRKMNNLEHKLRLLRNTVAKQKSAGVFLRRDAKGEVIDFEIIFPDTIVKLVDETGKTKAYQQVFKGMPSVDLTTDELLMIECLEAGELYPGRDWVPVDKPN